MYGCENWAIKKAECQRIDAFELVLEKTLESLLDSKDINSVNLKDFFGSSAGKESACNARDPGSIPGSGRYPGEGIGDPFQYSWASLVA